MSLVSESRGYPDLTYSICGMLRTMNPFQGCEKDRRMPWGREMSFGNRSLSGIVTGKSSPTDKAAVFIAAW